MHRGGWVVRHPSLHTSFGPDGIFLLHGERQRKVNGGVWPVESNSPVDTGKGGV